MTPSARPHIDLQPLTPGRLDEAHAAYSLATADVPHCYPVERERFAQAMPLPDASQRPAPPGTDRAAVRDERALLAYEAGDVVGLLHVGVRDRPSESRSPTAKRRTEAAGVIRFLWYARGHRFAGQALLDAAEEYWSEYPHRVTSADVCHYDFTYPFYYVEHAFLTDRLDHVHALLGANDYRRCGSELVLDWPRFVVAPPDMPLRDARLARTWVQGEGQHPGLVLKISHAGREVGVCVFTSLGDRFHAEEAQDWAYCRWLGIEADYQGRGLGRYLLLTALVEMQHMGYRHATLCTFSDNYRAFLLYSNLGYRTADWTYTFSKDLG